MNKPIQTPLISRVFVKELAQKWFIVSSDSLAPIMWRGYDLECTSIAYRSQLEEDDLLVIECHIAGRKHCSYQVGYYKHSDHQTLTLHYEDEELKESFNDWTIPNRQIRRVYLVDKIVRRYAHMAKFYPCSY